MQERIFLPTPICQPGTFLDSRINFKAERPNPIISIPAFAQERRYQEAARSAIETSAQGVTIYQPYLYSVEGKPQESQIEKPVHEIASRYASVKVGEREAWFEILGQVDRSGVTQIDFVTADPLQIILGDKNNTDVQNLHDYTDNPSNEKTIVRLVGIHEIPLYTGVERAVDPEEIQQAAMQLTKQLVISPTEESVEQKVPRVEDITDFIDRQSRFEHLVTASNGVEIGEPQTMEVMLDNSHPRLLFLYPTITPDGERATLITNKELTGPANPDSPSEKTIIGRTDFYCGCEKHGERAQGHGCGRELLGSLKDAISPQGEDSENDKTIIVAWGGVDDIGNGSVLHSIKTANAERTGVIIPQTQADTGRPTYMRRSREVFGRIPHIEHRDFTGMASVLMAGAEQVGATRILFHTGNPNKQEAVESARDNLFMQTNHYIELNADEHALRVVPEDVRRRDMEDRHPTRRGLIS